MPVEVVIAAAARTPIGSFQGALAPLSATVLGAAAIRAALDRAGVLGETVDEVLMGCVLSAAMGQAPARQASKAAGIPDIVGCTTVNKVCGSGLKTVMLAAQSIRAGDANTVVAGGMESMSNVPYLLPKARSGYRLGHAELVDGLVFDGLWDPYGNAHMGTFGDSCARDSGLSREQQDACAKLSYERARRAVEQGLFQAEIVAVEVSSRKKTVLVARDEEPFLGDPDKLAGLRPAFEKNGTVTAGNASALNDGASALVVMSAEEARRRGTVPMARITGYASHAQAPALFTTAPAGAIRRLLARAGLAVKDIDLWEINEAFAVVSLVNQAELAIPEDRLNVRGGAVALGHPIGCSGARILTTLVHALQQTDKRRGIASLCIGGGEAVAVMVER
ncbi:MAG: thiolase family protein [Nannocystaceae bacterium]